MSINLRSYTGAQPVNDFGLPFSTTRYSANLAATTDTSLTVPGVAPRYKAVITVESGGDVWMALNGTAAVPAGGSFAATTSELITGSNYKCREVRKGDVIHFYTATADTTVSVVFYTLNTPQ